MGYVECRLLPRERTSVPLANVDVASMGWALNPVPIERKPRATAVSRGEVFVHGEEVEVAVAEHAHRKELVLV